MTNEAPPHVHVLQLMMGLWHAQIVAAAARFGVADLIASGVHDSDSLAQECGADPDSLYRLLRACAALGIFFESEPRRFALTPAGECLRSNAPNSLRDFLIAETAPGHWLPWGRLYDAVKAGKSLSSEILGMPPWEYYAKNQEEGLSFARGMGNLSSIVAQDVTRVYAANGFQRIVDIGGSQGVLLRSLLATSPTARGVLFDLPEIIASAKPDERIELVGGSFFEEVPADGDLYLLKSILHDWPDDRCTEILKSIHRAAKPGATLLVVEMLLPDSPQPSPVAFMDLNMLVMLGGRERSAAEMSALLATGGFAVKRVLPIGMFSLIEAGRA
ncbi:MAG TPA: methyltransferase [Thermoanaerobaculia bacterium]|nr:methyltransferase [Thermoanaerobaculia bacterium]